MPGPCSPYVVQTLMHTGKVEGKEDMSEEGIACGVEECVYKAVPWVSKGHAQSHGSELIFSVV